MEVNFDGNITRYEYISNRPGTKAQGLLSAIVDPLNRRTVFTYYDNGKAFTQEEPGRGAWSFQYSTSASNPYTRIRAVDGTMLEVT